MKKPSDPPADWDAQLVRLIGLGERLLHSGHYPELQRRLTELGTASRSPAAHTPADARAETALQESERRLRTISDGFPIPAFAIDRDHRVIMWNQTVAEYTGIAAADMLGTAEHWRAFYAERRPTMADLMTDGLADQVPKWYPGISGASAVLAGAFEGTDYFPSVKGGRWLFFTAAALHDANGQVVGAVETLQDVTASKRAEEALRASELKYRQIVETSQEGILAIDDQARITFTNQRWNELLGYEANAMDGHPVAEFMPPEEWPDHEVRMRRRRAGIAERYERRYRHQDGRIIVTLTNATPLFDAAGQYSGSFAMLTDITDLKRAEAALRESQAVLMATLDASQDGVLVVAGDGTISHCNSRFREIWSIPNDVLAAGIDRALVEHVLPQVVDPDGFLARIKLLYATAARSEDLVTLRDGRAMERWSAPLIRDGAQQGRVWFFRDVTERHRAQDALQASELRFRSVFEQCPIGIAVYDAEGRVVSANQASLDIFGVPDRAAVIGWCFFNDPNLPADAVPRLRAGETVRFEVRYDSALSRPHGLPTTHTEPRDLDVIFTPLRPDADKPIQGYVLLAQDTTARKRLEAQLLQAQKMEAVGQLAGGVAHDFNNILTAILGNAEMTLDRLRESRSPADPAIDSLRQIERSAQRAAQLTRQLLAFSRRQVVQPRIVNVHDTLVEMEKMLHRVLTENITLVLRCERQSWPVEIDPGQLEQVVTNLVVNARDAMPDGGILTLETRNTVVDEDYVRMHAEAHSGPHVVVIISDTGSGMDAGVLERIFEPFYTTKPFGQGTGLGLATVYGIVRQAGGHVTVYSEPGHGSTFRVYLPALTGAPVSPAAVPASEAPPAGTETVLLCEDDDAVRDLATLALQRAGYTVLAAENGARALRLATAHGGAIDLLVTDVIMPDTNGRQLAVQLHETRPGLRVLFVSGYTAEVIAHHGVLDQNIEFLEKPFSRLTLLKRVRKLLDAATGGPVPGSRPA